MLRFFGAFFVFDQRSKLSLGVLKVSPYKVLHQICTRKFLKKERHNRLCRSQFFLLRFVQFSLGKHQIYAHTLAVSSQYFDTLIYTFIAIYKSLKILRNTVLFSLLPYSVPFKFIAKNAFAIL